MRWAHGFPRDPVFFPLTHPPSQSHFSNSNYAGPHHPGSLCIPHSCSCSTPFILLYIIEPYPRLFAPHHTTTLPFPLFFFFLPSRISTSTTIFTIFIDFTEYMSRPIAVGSFGHFCSVVVFQPASFPHLTSPPCPSHLPGPPLDIHT